MNSEDLRANLRGFRRRAQASPDARAPSPPAAYVPSPPAVPCAASPRSETFVFSASLVNEPPAGAETPSLFRRETARLLRGRRLRLLPAAGRRLPYFRAPSPRWLVLEVRVAAPACALLAAVQGRVCDARPCGFAPLATQPCVALGLCRREDGASFCSVFAHERGAVCLLQVNLETAARVASETPSPSPVPAVKRMVLDAAQQPLLFDRRASRLCVPPPPSGCVSLGGGRTGCVGRGCVERKMSAALAMFGRPKTLLDTRPEVRGLECQFLARCRGFAASPHNSACLYILLTK
eukprot:Gregarina_sp_Pseudo_9__1637@NODE_20_length_5835_cov_12_005003_g18_i0_p4_GENE_NODE_20_length_5835_cov_12_005003_g18_i0NODE_20_length_5835_cov_12_005003_g18_i0_p4_ORF_typecomplete_len293_score102_60_NODE_20_length_5835_cov_12_005003_g18_i042055083